MSEFSGAAFAGEWDTVRECVAIFKHVVEVRCGRSGAWGSKGGGLDPALEIYAHRPQAMGPGASCAGRLCVSSATFGRGGS